MLVKKKKMITCTKLQSKRSNRYTYQNTDFVANITWIWCEIEII